MQVAHAKKNLPKKRQELKKVENQANRDADQLKKLEDKLDTAKYDLEHFQKHTGFQEKNQADIEDQINQLCQSKREHDQLLQRTKRAQPQAFSEPRNPVGQGTQLDRDRIYGMLCKLFKVQDAQRFSVALEKVQGFQNFEEPYLT